MNDVRIDPTAEIHCDRFRAGDGTIIRAGVKIYGAEVTLGRECFIDEHAVIGGGSAHDGYLHAGHWLHMGMFSQINTARGVTIGDEVGLGIGTRVFTHGAYLSELDGFPVTFSDVTIGDRVWLPNAIVNPGSRIGSNVVVAAGSVVAGFIPHGCLAGGAPAKVIRHDAYPKELAPHKRAGILRRIADEAIADSDGHAIFTHSATFTPSSIIGKPSIQSERVRNQLRRHGIRYRYEIVDGEYVPWK